MMRNGALVMFAIFIFAVACQSQPEETEAVVTKVAESATAVSKSTSEPTPMTPASVSKANADVLFVLAEETAVNNWRFSVTVAHSDTGWENYADGWDVVLIDGTVIKPDADSPFTRLLLHPHENEQPFTRSQSNIQIPETATAVTVRAHDLVDGFGGQEVMVNLEKSAKMELYEVKRLEN